MKPSRTGGSAFVVLLLLVLAGLLAAGGSRADGRTVAPDDPAGTASGRERAPSGAVQQAPAPAPGGNWPAFRGPERSGVAADATPVTSWDVETGRNVRWTAPVPGYSHSSPVVWGARVFVTTAVSDDPSVYGRRRGTGNSAIDDVAPREWRLLAFDRSDGSVLWDRTAHRGAPRVRRHEKGSHANSTPVTDGRRVVAVFNSEGMYCWSVDGELMWSRDLGRLDPGYWGQPDNPWGHASSPILFEDTVIVQSDDFADSFLAAFRLEDGEEVWRVPREELATWSTPVVWGQGDDAVLVAQGGNRARAYDPRTGEELWSFEDHAEVKVPSPFLVDDLLILAGGYPRGRPVYAVDMERTAAALAAGDPAPVLRWTIERGGPYTSTPLGYRGRLYVTRDNGVFNSYDLDTGELVYQQRLSTGFSASPVAADGRLYMGSEDGDFSVVRAGGEFELLATMDMGEPIFATPALSGDLLVLRTREHLYGIGE